MTVTVNITEARTILAKLIDRALAGEDVVIARAGKPMVRLQTITAPEGRVDDLAVFGQAEGKIILDGGWDEAAFVSEPPSPQEAAATVVPFKAR
jgi:prevent-host-death family protein